MVFPFFLVHAAYSAARAMSVYRHLRASINDEFRATGAILYPDHFPGWQVMRRPLQAGKPDDPDVDSRGPASIPGITSPTLC
jgi:hypothetical protein